MHNMPIEVIERDPNLPMTLEDVCYELMFESEQDAQAILSKYFPELTVKIDEQGTTRIFDTNGTQLAMIVNTPASFVDEE